MHIGDVLLTTPLISNLAHYYPDAKIDFALNSGTEEMIENNPKINKIFIYEREKIKKSSFIKKIQREIAFLQEIRKEKYDIVINLTSSDRGIFLSIFSNSKKIISFPSKKSFLNKFISDPIKGTIQWKHWVDINLLALKTLNKNPVRKSVEIFWNDEVENNIKSILKNNNLNKNNFIHFHPLSRWFFKCIDDKLAAKIIDFIEKRMNLKVVLTAAPNHEELEKINNILRSTKTNPINLAGKLSLKEIASLNDKALAFVGVDTAIMHISAANNTPTLAFFGPSIPYAWGPWDNSKMINEYKCYRGNQKMGKHRILQESWECIPCDKKGCNNSGKSDCLLELKEENILKEIKEFLNGI
jgi:heptosyltransferase-3